MTNEVGEKIRKRIETLKLMKVNILPMSGDEETRKFIRAEIIGIEQALTAINYCISENAGRTEWIPVSERLPENLEPVNITWVNHDPEPYYNDIKDKPFTATGVYYRGQWYWYSSTCADYLGEYGRNEWDKVDDAIEIVAWMPLPEAYKGEGEKHE